MFGEGQTGVPRVSQNLKLHHMKGGSFFTCLAVAGTGEVSRIEAGICGKLEANSDWSTDEWELPDNFDSDPVPPASIPCLWPSCSYGSSTPCPTLTLVNYTLVHSVWLDCAGQEAA